MARPQRLYTTGATGDFDTGVYAFDGAGNVTKMGSHRFRYDLLSRIQEARVEVPGTGCGEELVLQNQTVSGTQTRESCGTIRAGPAYTVAGTGLWDSAKAQVTTHDWEMYGIIHAVVPTRLPIEEFYEEYARLWRTTLEVRYRERGRPKTYLKLAGALATGKVTWEAVQKGMRIADHFSKPETFLAAHATDRGRIESAAA